MWVLMEEFTNIRHYPVPRVPEGALRFVSAQWDEYVPRAAPHVPDVRTLWPQALVQEVPEVGHVWAYLLYVLHFIFDFFSINLKMFP